MFNIIVPIDFSDTSVTALRYGCYLADVTGYDLEAIHVHDGYDGDAGLVIKKGSARIRSRVRERLEVFVAQHADQATFAGSHDNSDVLPFIKCREVVGMAVDQLVKLSKYEDTALMVMGGVDSGISSPVTPYFASVAKEVVTLAGCPVLLIPPHTGAPDIKHAAIAFDEVSTLVGLSEQSEFLREALTPTMHFTHVLYREEESEELMELGLLRKMLNNDFPDYEVEFDLLPSGNVTKALVKYSREGNIDLLILGRRQSKGFLTKLLVKSETPDIVELCNIPTLVIPLGE
ncbi:universal stress protein [Neolewinella antarctica]|uniref:Nucleotide-binding universal stress UspA family protein n=1 Tax=Neolewinella antarctica TaxID=442734 RepID=A0ABX0XCJ7_9BACT|nr:universal stress protein [Neolewinella antarctica]NJC26985.1 nucleotide-binding universal stress UspA family protein [Neolewinella antarctica]